MWLTIKDFLEIRQCLHDMASDLDKMADNSEKQVKVLEEIEDSVGDIESGLIQLVEAIKEVR